MIATTAILFVACTGSAATSNPGDSLLPVPSVAPTVLPSPALSPSPLPSSSPSLEAVASPSPTPDPAAPAAPTNTRFVLVKATVAKDGFTTTDHYRATWSEPDGAATTFRIYGVTDCIRDSAENDNTPCVIAGTPIPASKLVLLATAPGTARTSNVTWTFTNEAGPGPYQAVLLVAENGQHASSPAILWSGLVCYGCVI